ncbi:MAG: fibro-slime domain-containing protein [Planctomycetota bacterium]
MNARTNRLARYAGTALAVCSLASVSVASGAFTLRTTVRDFSPSHPDFQGTGVTGEHVAGLFGSTLDASGLPVATLAGTEIVNPWSDAQGNSVMAPFGNSDMGSALEITDFAIDNGEVTVNSDFAVNVKILGSAIYSGSYHRPTTVRLEIGGQTIDPFGDYNAPVTTNLNDDPSATGKTHAGPYDYTINQIFPAGSTLNVTGRSWKKKSSAYSGLNNSHWETRRVADTESGSQQVFVLRDGDPVPNIQGVYNQASVEDFVEDYVDYDNNVMDLADNEVIYLYELGTTYNSSSADFQDLVVLVSLSSEPVAPALSTDPMVCGSSMTYTPPTFGSADTQGMTSASNAASWFADAPGMNASANRSIRFNDDDGDSVYEFNAPDFTPIDSQLYGNDDGNHNRSFTMSTEFTATYTACAGNFLELASDAGAWVYINGQLVIDLGGEASGKTQRIDLDRLSLTDGDSYSVQMFYAQRGTGSSGLTIRTNISPDPQDLSAASLNAFYD